MSPVHDAAGVGDLEEVKRLVQQDPQLVHSRDNAVKFTPLHCASHEGHVEVAAWLLSHGAHINQQDTWGLTACWWACFSRCLPILEMLLREGADTRISNPFGNTALMVAITRGHVDIARCLLDHPQALATIKHCDRVGWTALHVACERAGDLHGVVKDLLEAGADPTMATMNGETAMDVARHRGHDLCVELLEEWGRHYLLTKARHLHDASHDHDVSQALAHHLPSLSSSTVRTRGQVKRARIKAIPTYLTGRVEKGGPLPTVEVEVADEGGVEGDRKVKEVDNDLLVKVVLEHVLCGGLKGELFVELIEEVLGKTGYRMDRSTNAEGANDAAVAQQEDEEGGGEDEEDDDTDDDSEEKEEEEE